MANQLVRNEEPAPRLGRFMRLKDVVAETSLGVATIYRRMADGSFPQNRRLGGGRVAWLESDIEAWKHRAIAGDFEQSD